MVGHRKGGLLFGFLHRHVKLATGRIRPLPDSHLAARGQPGRQPVPAQPERLARTGFGLTQTHECYVLSTAISSPGTHTRIHPARLAPLHASALA